VWRAVACQQYASSPVACKHPPPFASTDIVCGYLITATLLGIGYAWVIWVGIEDAFQNVARIGLRWRSGAVILRVFAKLLIIEIEQYIPNALRNRVQVRRFRICI
jgi:hypothetical protein